ncbi:MAG: glycoside hydrolase family 3 C-terminal domain-containing protein, partial [Dehalococcoidia bacterium]
MAMDVRSGAAIEERIGELLRRLTLAEKLSLVGGSGSWHTTAVPRLGIPAIKMTDGPLGARGAGFGGATSACFPSGSALGASWDPDLVREVGAALGQEARSKGARVLLAPTVNIHRHPLAGRNFECFSEDPFLSSRMAAAYIQGVQSQGVAATVKHFVCNDSEYQRMTISSDVGERALREIYLPPFEAAVREAGAWALMSAYNRINGTYAAENGPLLLDLLKGEWEFDGLVMSDWWGTRSTAASANGGLDLEMPGPPRYFGEALRAAVEASEVAETTIDDKVLRLLRLMARTGALDDPAEPDERSIDDPDHRVLIRRAARDSMVLLQNEGGVLPLDADGSGLLAVIGPNADVLSVLGGGSARVEPHHVVSVLDGIAARAGAEMEVRFEPGCRIHRRTPAFERGLSIDGDAGPVPGVLVEFFKGLEFEGEPIHSYRGRRLQFSWTGDFAPGVIDGPFSMRARATFVPEESGPYRLTLTSAGLSRLRLDGAVVVDNWTAQTKGSSFYGRGSSEVEATVELVAGAAHAIVLEFQTTTREMVQGAIAGCQPPAPADQLERAVALAARADTAVVVVGLNADWETEGADRVSMDLPGDQDELIRRVAAVNPRTIVLVNAGSAVTMPWANEVAAILQIWYPGQEGGDAVADVLFGEADPGGRLPDTFPVRVEDNPADLTYPGEAGAVAYGEGVFAGYRGRSE